MTKTERHSRQVSPHRRLPLCSIRLVVVVLSLALNGGCDNANDTPNSAGIHDSESYVGAGTCAECHPAQMASWRNSHHALAMQPATEETVLGDFDDATFTHNGVTSRFIKRDGQYLVETDGPDGQLAVFPVRYTFGVYPLQQYLLELNDGKIQALSIAWDSRSAESGGQKWFHTYGAEERINSADVLHWTQPSQNWETMCADCHSTALVSDYQFSDDRFITHWAEINVACEACHGPAAEHLRWADSEPSTRSAVDKGFTLSFDERKGALWQADPVTGKPQRTPRLIPTKELNACGGCHSRRAKISALPEPQAELLDAYLPSLIEQPLYFADGQIRDEVYVLGSFLQSKMHQSGVTCSDCHEPHSLELRAPGAAVCLQCHNSERYAAVSHHLHADALEAQQPDCIDCHMPATVYMQNDARNDHSFRIPRPQLTEQFGIPNACNACHSDKSAAWASDALGGHGKLPNDAVTSHWTYKLAAADPATNRGRDLLIEIGSDPAYPVIIRATAIAQTGFGDSAPAQQLIARFTSADAPLIRLAAARALRNSAPSLTAKMAAPLLRDPVKAVRLEAAVALVAVDPILLAPGVNKEVQTAVQEYLDVQALNSERAESHVNVGNVERFRKRPELAQAAYRKALRQNPSFIPAYVNLADLYRELGRESEAEQLLREGLVVLPDEALLNYVLGLALVRQQRISEAVDYLGQAANSAEATPRYALVHVVALNSAGQVEAARRSVQDALRRFGPVPELQQLASELETDGQ
ncbi:MAG: multiheme c-type cytochrome [Gammaproteobacteria bacterium]|jgi:predicted CXXCH cytochrome family protein